MLEAEAWHAKALKARLTAAVKKNSSFLRRKKKKLDLQSGLTEIRTRVAGTFACQNPE
jgi:hypothetical protein